MIKITIEVSEDYLNEKANPGNLKVKGVGRSAIRNIIDRIGFMSLKSFVDEGQTEFIVSPDDLDEATMKLYNAEIGTICHLAIYREIDKKVSKKKNSK